MNTKTKIEVKKLEIQHKPAGIKGYLKSKQTRKTFIAVFIGAVGAFAWFYFTEGQHAESLSFKDISGNMAIGAALGFFVTNSPCARGRC